MSSYEVEQPILNSPYDEPAEHWYIDEGTPPERRSGRRPAGYFYRDPTAPPTEGEHEARGQWVELALVNLIRERLNVTIRNWLQELDPANGEASLYRTRDLVPPHLMPDLIRGRVLVTNWHVFEPQGIQVGGLSAKVSKAGVPVRVKETITIGAKTPTARGRRYLTPAELDWQVAAGLLTVLSEERDSQGHLKKVFVESVKYVESDIALVNRILGREVGGKQNILVFNADIRDVFLSPSYGWVIERLVGAITGEVDFWTSREVREVIH
ncbi:MAG: hypothetical protein HYZ81_27125, partial [Nitrospinae bacterium]|nr:hypothetical protein [Nitrospinota bacterium]